MYSNNSYYKQHLCCPRCGEIPHLQTYMGMVNPSDKNPDYNECVCDCGWSWIVHDLVKKRGWFSSLIWKVFKHESN